MKATGFRSSPSIVVHQVTVHIVGPFEKVAVGPNMHVSCFETGNEESQSRFHESEPFQEVLFVHGADCDLQKVGVSGEKVAGFQECGIWISGVSVHLRAAVVTATTDPGMSSRKNAIR